jgi:mannitol/fructose-specific phosphotransferase system IIA component (Ntr-type)
LTLQENLNYIKFNLKDTHEAFRIFDETKSTFENRPEIAASMIQKLATKSKITPKNFDEKLFARVEYKGMLRQIKEGLDFLDNKQFIDTIFSLGKLHKG